MYKKKFMLKRRAIKKIYIFIFAYICIKISKINKFKERKKTGQMGDRYGKFFIAYFIFLN